MGSLFGLLWYYLITFYCFSVPYSVAVDFISAGQSVRDGETLISAGQKFALGFFSPPNSDSRYVGIWYNGIENESAVWVANRDRPIQGTGGVLTIGLNGTLVALNGNGDLVWTSGNETVLSSGNSTAVLTDTGNFILNSGEIPNRVLWQSFNNPTDTYLPDMRIHFSNEERRFFTSWRSASDPSPGDYSMGVDPRGAPQIVIWNGARRRWRSGHWNGREFTGVPGVRAVYLYGFRVLHEPDGRLYFVYTLSNASDVIKFSLTWEGIEREERWNVEQNEWNEIQSHPVLECDGYNYCGAFGKCNQMEKNGCSCVEGFVPADEEGWRRGEWSGGCTRRTRLQCESGGRDDFAQIGNVKLPDNVDYVGSQDNETVCVDMCLQNCSCTAYAFVNGIGCLIWNHELVDIQQFVEGGSSLFLRLAPSELAGGKNHTAKIVAIIIAAVFGTFLVVASVWFFFRRKRKSPVILSISSMPRRVDSSGEISREFIPCDQLAMEGQHATGSELSMFSFNYVAAATNNFSDKSKLGHGGFGHVYKGTLPGGQEIAVKRLSRRSGQGLEEFKNEITLIAKLQHRNLVRLMGCCVQGDERMLLYEYMPNNSLDSYLFDPDKRGKLDWNKRLNIIEGIARGLVYLHRDSRLRIIHRDLKASNILLDEEMNPKISDFGMARIFGGNQNDANTTNRVVGTFGYMAPEYAMEGLFSLKSDVYSFGVLLLEIISGQKNTAYRSTEYSNIIGYAWDLWNSSRAIDLLDPSISKSCSVEQVVRCVQIAMLCVQDVAGQRPDMQAVVVMLESPNGALPLPREPTFTSTRLHSMDGEEIWPGLNLDGVSSNNVTISVILGR